MAKENTPALALCIDFTLSTVRAGAAAEAVAYFVKGFLTEVEGCLPQLYILAGENEQYHYPLYELLGDITGVRSELHRLPEGNMDRVFHAMKNIFDKEPGLEALYHIYGDSPFLNRQVNWEILDLYHRYRSDYVFCEGYPLGIGGQLLTRDLTAMLERDGEGVPPGRQGIFDSVAVNINSHDIETAIAPMDLRMERLELFHDNPRNAMLCASLEDELSQDMTGPELCKTLEESRARFRTLPAFFALQISSRCPQSCSYCPYPLMNPNLLSSDTYLTSEDFRQRLEAILKLVDDPVVSLSAFGEPASHPALVELLGMASGYPQVHFLIETSGLGWTEEALSALKSLASGRLNVILSLDAIDPRLYQQLRGQGFEEAMAFAQWAGEALSGHFHVQAVRMKENEEHLLQFYQHWKAKSVPFIIQKYNDHGGLLPSRSVADLSPLKRHECWHLKRELVIMLDGNCYSCLAHASDQKEDFSLGNLRTDDIHKIWAAGDPLYRRHVQGDLPPICQRCDEWYSFNF